MSEKLGLPSPLGVTLEREGANVAMFSRHGTGIQICLFDDAGEMEVQRLDLPQRSGDIHFGFIKGLKQGTRYGLRVEGPWEPGLGHRFDSSKLLVDPYATEFDRPFTYDAALAQRGADTAAFMPKCIAQPVLPDVKQLPYRKPDFIYEIPVKAFTMLHPGVPPEKRGKISALSEPAVMAHLQRIGVDTVELMPIAAWIDERHLPPLGLRNAWGYNSVAFFAPDPRLAPGGLTEVRDTVSVLHAAGIRVVLDVVFNHTGESDAFGPTLSFRGFDNSVYYAHAGGTLINDTGCGNTLALNQSPMLQLVIAALRHWVLKTGVDGFRFDLATVMGRMAHGFSVKAPLLAAIEEDPLLAKCIMIAEPWDVGPGGYQLGHFPARWHEWNDRYRDDVRKFWRGDAHSANSMATRLVGSSDIFAPDRKPSCSINFIAAHDGFTLRDATTYQTKNNYANGEDNRDGNSHEPTWVGGDVRAFLVTLFFSRGTVMLTAGDEFGRTQNGNNNAYAQDNATTWLDWATADKILVDFVAELAALRRENKIIRDDRFLDGGSDAIWLGDDGRPLDWSKPATRILGLVLESGENRIAIWINGQLTTVNPKLEPHKGCKWVQRFCSSAGNSPRHQAVSLYIEQPDEEA